ncbi:MAG: hypothetical protein UU06_C0008G0006 [Parcubacteria group bacterium GW2011_GWB1_40_5]|nr:MAG: hypothetical protein UU06_C0008G0006 [Parcubacteria group bacterium GW2011_GWB1_40_5]KKR80884.1 MAG: hypothetical protein UU27_C0020G0010 [Parcubacteria group bacterium GW2011_GWD1_40_9]
MSLRTCMVAIAIICVIEGFVALGYIALGPGFWFLCVFAGMISGEEVHTHGLLRAHIVPALLTGLLLLKVLGVEYHPTRESLHQADIVIGPIVFVFVAIWRRFH